MGVILSVDDDPIMLDLLDELFADSGLELIKASNAFEAIELAESYEVDVAILDISLPQMNGFELLSALRQIDPFTKFIFLSSEMNKKNLLKALRIGAVDFYQKPYVSELLVQSVRKYRTSAIEYRNMRKAI